VYDVDPVTFGVLDFTVYYADLSSPTYQSSPTWAKLYSAKEAYGTPLGVTDAAAELTPAFWHNVTALFQTDDAVFQQYHARKSRGADASSCTGDCKTAEICQLRAAQAQYNCGVITPGIHFRRDASSASGTAGAATAAGSECEGSRAVPILAAMTGQTGIDALRSAIVGALGADVLSTEVPANYTANGTAYWAQ
jgi:sphingomyelin phosphodiesterase